MRGIPAVPITVQLSTLGASHAAVETIALVVVAGEVVVKSVSRSSSQRAAPLFDICTQQSHIILLINARSQHSTPAEHAHTTRSLVSAAANQHIVGAK